MKWARLIDPKNFPRAGVGYAGEQIVRRIARHIAVGGQVPFANNILMLLVVRAVVKRKIDAGVRQAAIVLTCFRCDCVELSVTKRTGVIEIGMESNSGEA